jgi:hypothetical protein
LEAREAAADPPSITVLGKLFSLVPLRILPAVCIEKREGLPLSLGLWWFSPGSQLKNVN